MSATTATTKNAVLHFGNEVMAVLPSLHMHGPASPPPPRPTPPGPSRRSSGLTPLAGPTLARFPPPASLHSKVNLQLSRGESLVTDSAPPGTLVPYRPESGTNSMGLNEQFVIHEAIAGSGEEERR
jgi:hypothetical protein